VFCGLPPSSAKCQWASGAFLLLVSATEDAQPDGPFEQRQRCFVLAAENLAFLACCTFMSLVTPLSLLTALTWVLDIGQDIRVCFASKEPYWFLFSPC